MSFLSSYRGHRRKYTANDVLNAIEERQRQVASSTKPNRRGLSQPLPKPDDSRYIRGMQTTGLKNESINPSAYVPCYHRDIMCTSNTCTHDVDHEHHVHMLSENILGFAM
jgi:hypothetical protein